MTPAWLDGVAPVTPGRAVVVVAPRAGGADVAALSAWAGTERVVRFDGDVAALHASLSMLGPFDLVVDGSDTAHLRARFLCAVDHLVEGGRLVVRVPPRGSQRRERLQETLDAALAIRDAGEVLTPHRRDRRPRAVRELHALAATLGEVRSDDLDGVVEVVSSARLLATLADSELTAAALTLRPGLGAVVDRVEAVTWTASGSFTSTSPDDDPIGEIAAPELRLREYHDVTALPRMVLLTDGLVLPDTFRHPERPGLSTPMLQTWNARSVAEPAHAAAQRLDGVWFYADNVMRGHFGHALTEQVSRLWAWPEALRRHPDLRALVTSESGEPPAAWELMLLEAAGIERDRVHCATGPVQVETLLAATPAYEIDHHVHPVMRTVYDTLASDLLARAAPDAGRHRRVFLTRRNDRRVCTDGAWIEALMVQHGFHVVAPEELPLPDQVSLVDGADVVAGYAGSAMFHVVLARRPQRVLAITHDNYHAANERHMCALRGHDLTLVRGRPVEQRKAFFTNKAFHSAFRIDPDVEGRVLREFLERL